MDLDFQGCLRVPGAFAQLGVLDISTVFASGTHYIYLKT